MKVANKKPKQYAGPVYVNKEIYEIFYSKPVSLGRIEFRGGYWYTVDGHRFVSSRDATKYLVGLRDSKFPIRDEQLANAVALPLVRKKRVGATVSEPVNQNHPLFQQFLEWVEFSNRKRNEPHTHANKG